MANRGGQPGNNNGGKGKIWTDAIRKAVTDKDHKTLNKLAKVLVMKADKGDMAALKEIGDRLEGKPAQTVEGPGSDGAFIIKITSDDESVL